MIPIEALICKVCGATINTKTMQCDYCGTVYDGVKEDASTHAIWVDSTQTKCLEVRISVPSSEVYRIGEEKAHEIIIENFAKQLAEKIVPYIWYYEDYDIAEMKYNCIGRLKVIPPKYGY